MRSARALVLAMLLAFPVLAASCTPVKIDVPIYVPADFPVSGTVCLTSQMASNLKARLYVDGSFFQEGTADEMGCYRILIRPLTAGSHVLYAEIFRGDEKVAEIEAKVIAIKGMLLVKPQPLTEIRRGERKEAIMVIENRAPLNLTNVFLEVEAPFPIFGERMIRVRDFVIYGRIGDLPMNGSKSLKLILAVPREFRPGSHDLKVNLTYEVASQKYSVLLRTNVIVLNETYSVETLTSAFESERAMLNLLNALLALIAISVLVGVILAWRRAKG